MSNHEFGSQDNYRPDQPYKELDDNTLTVMAFIAEGDFRPPAEIAAQIAKMAGLLDRLMEAAPSLNLPSSEEFMERLEQRDNAGGTTAEFMKHWRQRWRRGDTGDTTTPNAAP